MVNFNLGDKSDKDGIVNMTRTRDVGRSFIGGSKGSFISETMLWIFIKIFNTYFLYDKLAFL